MYILFHHEDYRRTTSHSSGFWSSSDVYLASENEIFVGKFRYLSSYLYECHVNQLGESTFLVACLPCQDHTLECEGMKAVLFAQEDTDGHSEFSLYLLICQTCKISKDFAARHF